VHRPEYDKHKPSHSAILQATSADRNACIGHPANRDDQMKSKDIACFVKVLACDQDSHVTASPSLREKQMAMQKQVASAI